MQEDFATLLSLWPPIVPCPKLMALSWLVAFFDGKFFTVSQEKGKLQIGRRLKKDWNAFFIRSTLHSAHQLLPDPRNQLTASP